MDLSSILERFKNSSLEPKENIQTTLKELVQLSDQVPFPASGNFKTLANFKPDLGNQFKSGQNI